jgi:PadR family transcriptional regulator, regulatory protein PadR
MSDNLGINELRVLSTLMGKEKYGLEIIRFVKDETGKELSLGGLYTTLHRLEKKGYVNGRHGEATAERGGNRRKYYKLTGTGQKVLADARQSLSPLWGLGVQGV